ncbi:MAG: glycosyltransferase family 2 protein [Candidatus Bipolaricaulota bacterium]|nr:glycosyltransferase family 2 protein [Candidatus Bipolaricaulota bacterium]MCS7274305.1 glycosyltransferase family 2 protein [Candidatus Bipolaricaulota bacterium]MDW8111444.1 glycosyltransferase family 2 protein [Candidatus Bipolaricaulota bacterium]MDW8329735.1 glycosyltransferase family 2 protein [Candidatus Bipolaricaulota bacterium]
MSTSQRVAGVSAVIPAYNEAERIAAVLEPLKRVPAVRQVIVVDDGSTDGTAHVARHHGAQVISLPVNRGKAAALDAGVRRARYDTVLFLDADLVGLRPDHIQRMLDAFFEHRYDMVVGVFRRGRLNTDFAQVVAPYLSGQRVLRKSLWKRLRSKVQRLDFGVEIALTKLALKEGWAQGTVELDGVTHVMKEEKRGLSRGLVARFKMYGDYVRSVFTRVS